MNATIATLILLPAATVAGLVLWWWKTYQEK